MYKGKVLQGLQENKAGLNSLPKYNTENKLNRRSQIPKRKEKILNATSKHRRQNQKPPAGPPQRTPNSTKLKNI
jgi:hypothetical protein